MRPMLSVSLPRRADDSVSSSTNMNVCITCKGQKTQSCDACKGRGRRGGILGLFARRCAACAGDGTVLCSKCLGTGEAVDAKLRSDILTTIDATMSANRGGNYAALGAVVLEARLRVRSLPELDRLRYMQALNDVWDNIDYSSTERAGAIQTFVMLMRDALED